MVIWPSCRNWDICIKYSGWDSEKAVIFLMVTLDVYFFTLCLFSLFLLGIHVWWLAVQQPFLQAWRWSHTLDVDDTGEKKKKFSLWITWYGPNQYSCHLSSMPVASYSSRRHFPGGFTHLFYSDCLLGLLHSCYCRTEILLFSVLNSLSGLLLLLFRSLWFDGANPPGSS